MKSKPNSSVSSIGKSVFLGLALAGLAAPLARATPYASGLTNNGNGTFSFWLNEGGGNVTIVYEDGTTNANYNGVTSGTNLPSGQYTFAFAAPHTSYTILAYKVGAGVPSLINQSLAFTPRGVDVNKHPTSPFFGRVYATDYETGIYVMNSDLSLAIGTAQTGGQSWGTTAFSPYRIYVADDDYLMIGDASSAHAGVYRADPNIQSAGLFLGPMGESAGLAAGVFGTIESRPLLLGNITNGPATLMQVDGDFTAAGGYNSLLVYTNITLAAVPWQNPPDIQGPEIGLDLTSETLGGNEYPGLQPGPNGYIYASTYRLNLSNPLLQIYSYSPSAGFSQVWNSYYNGATADYFLTSNGAYSGVGIADIAVSPDGKYVAGMAYRNYFVICPLINGIPDVANLFLSTPTSYTTAARGLAFDAADNLYLSSSGISLVQSWSLGITTTAVTTGNANGVTDFYLLFPSTTVNVVATSNFASQGGANGAAGTPVPGVFTITRTDANDNYSIPITVNFSLGGTASNGVYTLTPSISTITPAGANNSIVLLPGVLSTNITITPATANVPRLQTTVVLALKGGSGYKVAQPSSDTVYIQNTSSNQLVLSAAAATMYKAFASDFASVNVTRLGDTNVGPYTIPASAWNYSGVAQSGADFVPIPALTINPGTIALPAMIYPLANGVPPVDVASPVYVGNKSVTVSLSAGPQYLTTPNAFTLTLLDNADPPALKNLLTDPLTNPGDASNWTITYGTGNEYDQPANYDVEFGYDLTASNSESLLNGLIGLPPNGATTALRITCNKYSSLTWGGGVNVYYTSQAFSGNYAVRFNMNLTEGDDSLYGVEGAMFGINHNGTETNWWLGSGTVVNENGLTSGPWASDGVWYWVQAPPGGIGGFGFTEFEEYTGAGGKLPNTGWTELNSVGAASFVNVFKSSVFTAPGGLSGGTPANNPPTSANPQDNNWADVEIKQIKGVITLSINKTPIFVYTNTTVFTNGYLMLGYDCPIAGAYNQYVGSPDAAVYFSNLRVVQLGPPVIASITSQVTAGVNNVTIKFASTDGDDSTASFALQSASAAAGPYADVAGAVFTQVATGNGTSVFQTTTTQTSARQFYRIRHL